MKKTTNDTKKVRNIEHTVKKNNVRFDIIGQILQWVAHQATTKKPVEHIHSATLPADKGYFENALHHSLETNPFLIKRPTISFDCAERIKTIAIKAMRALPEGSHILNGDYKDLFKKKLVRQSGGAFAVDGKIAEPNVINLAWADYCCPANMKLTNDFVDMIINHMESGLAYLTFCGHSRNQGGRKAIAKKFSRYATDKESTMALQINNGVIEAILAKLEAKTNKKVQLVYNVIYGGGQKGNTTMMTIGFSVNLPKKAITLIEDYRQGSTSNDGKVYRMSTSLSSRHGWKIKERKQHKRKGKRGRNLSPERQAEIKAEEKAKNSRRLKISNRYKKGLDNQTIAEQLGLSVGSVKSITAWMNPEGKLAKKRKTIA